MRQFRQRYVPFTLTACQRPPWRFLALMASLVLTLAGCDGGGGGGY